ncbi:MAG: TIGR04211 family SH3 domain-containing protein [Deltaproteobacteria bacterium]|nr:TIGR04211 family SH3 domain-containing protein [Deltaproteobacteria bacterium]
MKKLYKQILFLGIVLMFFSANGLAETMYVTDMLKLTLRSGPSLEHKILAVIKSGQQIELLEPGEDWSLVRTAGEKEGYVLTRYLLSEPTHNVRLEKLQSKHKALMQQAATLLEENTRFKKEGRKLKSTLDVNEKALNKLRVDYEKLKAGSAEYIELKEKFKTVSGQLAEQTKRAEALDEELRSIEINQYIKWFLAGSGVLLVGFIVGFSVRRQRRRPSLL